MWYLCMRCERAQWHDIEPKDTRIRPIQCGFGDCSGQAWPYHYILELFSDVASGWPKVPEEGKVYPVRGVKPS
jgi:hypothetical protein